MSTPPDTVILSRDVFTDKTTVSDLWIDSMWQCYALEPTCRTQPGVKIAIPQGKYELVMFDSPHVTLNQASKYFGKKVPLLLKVPGHSFVEIHPGNCLADTHDCILPGSGRSVDWVSNSDVAWEKLVAKIEQKLTLGKFYIGITGGGIEC